MTARESYRTGRLTARPDHQREKEAAVSGVHALGLNRRRDGLLYIPTSYTPGQPAALALLLHGAGGVAEHGLSILRSYADEHNMLLLAPASRAGTWDIIAEDAFGTDVILLDQALTLAFEKYTIDPARIAIGGFSDGASYALCLGLTNGDLFTHILAFSPGFAFTRERNGQPSVFISHGTDDHILPIDVCSRRIVPQLQGQGYRVNYQEFTGEHVIPPAVAAQGVAWFTRRAGHR